MIKMSPGQTYVVLLFDLQYKKGLSADILVLTAFVGHPFI